MSRPRCNSHQRDPGDPSRAIDDIIAEAVSEAVRRSLSDLSQNRSEDAPRNTQSAAGTDQHLENRGKIASLSI